MRLVLPWPPTVNSYYRNGDRPGFRYLTNEAKAFRTAVSLIVGSERMRKGLAGRLRMVVVANPPDRRERDLDNLQKGLWDSLQHAGVYERDSQIDEFTILRGPVMRGGQVVVEITELTAETVDAREMWRELV